MKKNFFYLFLILIYILFLTKDMFIGLINNTRKIENTICSIEESNIYNEYNSLLNLVNINKDRTNIIYSKIIQREIYEFYDTITINKGSNDNVKKGDVVINEFGLVGVITKVFNNNSEVSLITNNNTSISVMVGNSFGILYSKDHKLYVKNLKIDGEIKENDTVITSGLTSIPKGIKIGNIKDIKKDSLELEYILDIENINLHNLEFVGVISS